MATDILSNVYLFKTLSVEDLEQVAQIATMDKWHCGETIFSQGEVAKAMYIVKYGSVDIKRSTTAGDEVEVAVLGTGSHFGEMAFIDGAKRNATANVMETSEILRVDFDKLKALLELNPRISANFYKAVAHFLSGRLTETTKDLSFAREKNRSHG